MRTVHMNQMQMNICKRLGITPQAYANASIENARSEEAFKLYNYVVHIEEQKVTVTTIGEGSSRNIQHMEETPYANIEEVPEALRNSVKRLMWCTDGDIHAGLGMKVNDSTYWVN